MTTLDTTDPVPVDPVHADPETPWEPPLAGTETEALLGALDRLRWTFRYKADGLDEAGLDPRVGASSLTLGGPLKHLALVEDEKATENLDRGPYCEPWDLQGVGDPELSALYDRAVSRAHATVTAVLGDGGRVGEDPPPGWRPVAGDSAVWDG